MIPVPDVFLSYDMKLYNVDPFPGPLEQGGLGPRIEVCSRDLGDNFLISCSAPLPNRSAKSGWNEMLSPDMSSPRWFRRLLGWQGTVRPSPEPSALCESAKTNCLSEELILSASTF